MSSIQRKPALSISAMDMLSKCGEQYRRRYIEREKIPPGISLIVGKGVDASVDKNMLSKIENDSLLSIDEIETAARDAVVSEWGASEVALSEEEVKLGIAAVKAQAIDKAVRLARLHANDAAPTLKPTAVQRSWRIELENYPMDLTGKIDIQEAATVRDTKTSAKSPREDEAHLSDQLTFYALAAMVLDGKAPAKVALDYLVDLKTKPKLVTRESDRTHDDFRVMLRRVETAQAAIEKAVFVPARQSDWWCSPRWCGYFQTCPYARAPKSFTVGEISE